MSMHAMYASVKTNSGRLLYLFRRKLPCRKACGALVVLRVIVVVVVIVL